MIAAVAVASRITGAKVIQRVIRCWRLCIVPEVARRNMRVSASIVSRACVAMAVKSLLKLCSWDAIKAAFSCRRASRSAFSLSLSRGVGFPVVMEDVSFQSPAFAGLGVLDGEVFLARARDGEADIGHQGDHAGTVGDGADGDLVEDPGLDFLAGLGALGSFEDGLHFLRAVGVHGVGPAVGLVHQVAKGVKSGLIAGWGDVQAAAGGQVEARSAEVQFDAAFIAVANPEDVELLGVEAREGELFEAVHDLDLLRLRRGIASGEADDTGAVGPGVGAGIDQRLGPVGITTQDLRARVADSMGRPAVRIADQVAVGIVGQHLIGDQVADGAGPAPLAVGEELDQHSRPWARSWAS